MNEAFTYPDNWQRRVDFYGEKWESYKEKYPDRYPAKSTVRRWVRECNEKLKEE